MPFNGAAAQAFLVPLISMSAHACTPTTHLICREEEVPFIEAAYKARQDQEAVAHEEANALFLTRHREAWELDIVVKKRLEKMGEDRCAPRRQWERQGCATCPWLVVCMHCA